MISFYTVLQHFSKLKGHEVVGAVGSVQAVDAGRSVPVQEPSGSLGMFVTASGLIVACVSTVSGWIFSRSDLMSESST